MKSLQRIVIGCAAMLAGLSIVSSCVEDDPDNYRTAMLNKKIFSFGEAGGIDTLYATDNDNYEISSVQLQDTADYSSIFDAEMGQGDTAFVNDKNETIGKITYQDGLFYSLETEWYSVYKDESDNGFRYIIKAHPGDCHYELSLFVSLKHGSSMVLVKRE